MKLRVKDKFYPMANVQSITLMDALEMQAALRDYPHMSAARTMADVLEILDEFVHLPSEERADHPEGLFLSLVTIWVTRRRGGEQISFIDSTDLTVFDFDWIREPSDPEPSAEGKATAATNGSPARRAAADHLPKRKTSKTA